MKKVLVLTLICFQTLLAGNKLTSSFEFLRTDFSPRTIAMSNAFSTLRNDVSAIFINPAGLAFSEGRQFGVPYTKYLLDISGGYMAYTQPVEGFGILGASIVYIDYGTFKETDEFATETGSSFSASDLALTLSWGDHFEQNISYGANVKYVFSSIENYNASAIAVDLGLIWDASIFQDNLFFGFSVLNIGSNFEYYADVKEPLPLSTRFGFSKILEHLPLEISLSLIDIHEEENFGDIFKDFAVGGEFRLSESLRLRMGYNNRRHLDLAATEESEFGGVSGGLGIYFGKYRFDYAYSNYNLLGNTHTFGLYGTL